MRLSPARTRSNDAPCWSGRSSSAMLAVSNIEELVRRSNLLGADRTIANQGGGNTSMKGLTIDHAGREVSVVWVKASGADLASVTKPGFPALGLDDLRLLLERDEMSDQEMLEYIRSCALDSNAPRPSIETLLHAFLPATHIDHTHPDAAIALTAIPSGRELAEGVFGDEALWIPWKRLGSRSRKTSPARSPSILRVGPACSGSTG